MERVAIIGAGELGGAIAHTIARRNLARSITLIDESGDIARGKALDITESAPVEGFSTLLSGDRDLAAAIGAEAIVIADRAGALPEGKAPSAGTVPGGVAGSAEWEGDEGWLLVKQLASIRAGAIVLCAGASQSELIGRGTGELRVPRSCLFGSAPEALASRARALVALALNGSPRDVVISVLGAPPTHTMVAWEEASVAGFALTRLLDDTSRRHLIAQMLAMWPPGPHALAAAAATALDALTGRSRQILSCYVAPDSFGGVNRRTAALPVRLGPSGIVEVIEPVLSAVERVALDNAILL